MENSHLLIGRAVAGDACTGRRPGMQPLTVFVLAALTPAAVLAQATPVGLWKTIDDANGKEKSLVRIVDSDGIVSGRVEKLLNPDKPEPRCDKCSDERRDQPVLGMTILRNVRRNADDTGRWDGGDILDPENGKVYRVRLRPLDDGRRLEVRGYIGAPLLGRSQTWWRVE